MSVYTKTGDNGQTSLYTGERVAKSSRRVETYGTIDEANSALAAARAFAENVAVQKKILALQKLLPLQMADLASVDKPPLIKDAHIKALEQEMDEMETALPPLKEFLIPGNSKAGAFLDMARTVVRRAERRFVALTQEELTHETNRLFINRLSDYCFLLMRLEDTYVTEKQLS